MVPTHIDNRGAILSNTPRNDSTSLYTSSPKYAIPTCVRYSLNLSCFKKPSCSGYILSISHGTVHHIDLVSSAAPVSFCMFNHINY